jgi:hypothetical protein
MRCSTSVELGFDFAEHCFVDLLQHMQLHVQLFGTRIGAHHICGEFEQIGLNHHNTTEPSSEAHEQSQPNQHDREAYRKLRLQISLFARFTPHRKGGILWSAPAAAAKSSATRQQSNSKPEQLTIGGL